MQRNIAIATVCLKEKVNDAEYVLIAVKYCLNFGNLIRVIYGYVKSSKTSFVQPKLSAQYMRHANVLKKILQTKDERPCFILHGRNHVDKSLSEK